MKIKVSKGVHNPSRLVEWARQREMLPRDKYALGPTGLVFPAKTYYWEVFSSYQPGLNTTDIAQKNPDYKLFRWAAKGGLLQSIIGDGESVKTIYVVDNRYTRQTLTAIFSRDTFRHRATEIRAMMLMTTYKEAWQEVVTQLIPLRTALSTSDWKGLLTDNGMINLRDWVSFGRLVDEGRLPFDLLLTAMSMASVWVEDFLRNQHESGGIWRYRGLRAQLIRVTHGTSSRVNVHPLSRAYLTYSSVHKRVFPHLRIHDILKPKKRT